MAKVNGLGWTTASYDDAASVQQDIKNDITNLDFATPRAVQDVTGLNSFAIERILLLADCTLNTNGVFNPAANASHDVFSSIPSTSVNRLVTLTTNGKTFAPTLVLTDYQITRATNSDLTWKVPASNANGQVPTWV